jgi:hypothetical protein
MATATDALVLVGTQDPRFLGFAVFINVAYWVAMLPELRQYFARLGKNFMPSNEEMAQEWGMGAMIGRMRIDTAYPPFSDGYVGMWTRDPGSASHCPAKHMMACRCFPQCLCASLRSSRPMLHTFPGRRLSSLHRMSSRSSEAALHTSR